MNILNTILENALNPNTLNQLSNKTGIDSNNLSSLISEIAPQLINGAKENLASNRSSSSLIDMISHTNIDDLNNNPEMIEQTNNSEMLGELFASTNNSEADVAQALSSKSGIDVSSIASLLPMIAPFVMGALNKQTNLGSQDTSNTNDITSMLTNFLDQDNDGSVVDDLLGMANKFFK